MRAMRSGRLFAAASRLVRQEGTSVKAFRVSEIGSPSSRIWKFLRFAHVSAPLYERLPLVRDDAAAHGYAREWRRIVAEETAAFCTLMNTELDHDETVPGYFLKLPDAFRWKWRYRDDLPVEVYKRDCYDALVPCIMSYFEERKAKGIVLTGTPGIGKTGFLWYLLWHILKHRQEDVVLALTGRYCLVQRKDGNLEVTVTRDIDTVEASLGWGSRAWFLADTLVPADCLTFPFKFLLTCSPRKSNSGEMKKGGGVKEFYLPVWTEEELCRLGQRVFGLKLEDIKERFGKWGGVPRFVLDKVDPAEQESLLTAINSAVRHDLTRIQFNENLAAIPDNLSHKVFHCMPVGDDYTRCRYILASSYVVEELLKRSPETVLESFLHEKVDEQLLDIQAAMWEKYVLQYLEFGGDLQMRELSGRVSTPHKATFPAAKRIHRAEYTYISVIREGGQTWKYDKKGKKKVGDPIADPGRDAVFALEVPVLPDTVTDDSRDTLICSLSRTNANWDAIRGKKIFQITVSNSREPVKADSFQMMETFRFLDMLYGNRCEIDFVYVVPRFIYPTFTLGSNSTDHKKRNVADLKKTDLKKTNLKKPNVTKKGNVTDLNKRNVNLSVATIPSKPPLLPKLLQDYISSKN